MSCLAVSPVAGCVVVAIELLLINFALEILHGLPPCSIPIFDSRSALDSRHQLLDLGFLLAGKRQEWQPRRASIVAVEVHGVLHAGDAEFTDHALGDDLHALLFFAGERVVSVFERGVDFVTRGGCWTRKR